MFGNIVNSAYLGRCISRDRCVYRMLVARFLSYGYPKSSCLIPQHHRSRLARSARIAQHRRSHTSAPLEQVPAMELIRNVGVIAHIDAGKTTTTERMLYFAHRTHHLGEVDRGDTVTDYLPEERDRGISIVSAAACLTWRHHTLHLLDTPGHVDFTMEVERSLSVMDGAIAILDGTKGVQAQTRTVWHQADRYCLPRLVYVNKLDRDAASLERSLATLSAQLTSETRYAAIHWPVFTEHLVAQTAVRGRPTGPQKLPNARNRFVGLVDLTSMKLNDWSKCTSPDTPFSVHDLLLHEDFESTKVTHAVSALTPESLRAAFTARAQLLGTLADVDEEFADQFLSVDNPETLLPAATVQKALRRATVAGRVVPVLVGSSRQSIGVQPLLDGIVDYLPDPSQCGLPGPVQQLIHRLLPQLVGQLAGHLSTSGKSRGVPSPSADPVMLVFKVCFDPHRGPLTLVRVYSGTVRAGSVVTNWSQRSHTHTTEKVQTVFQLTGDHREVVEYAGPGSIVALAGLQSTHSGDLLGPSIRSTNPLSQTVEDDWFSEDTEDVFPELTRREPVVYAAVEPASLSTVRNLEHALTCMQREDPSFTAHLDPDTGQWAIGGMGDLHLEVVMARLKREYKVDASMGPLLIAYKECPSPGSKAEGKVVQGYGYSSGLVEGRERAFLVAVTVQMSNKKTPQIRFNHSLLGSTESSGSDEITAGTQSRIRQTLRQSCLSTLEIGGPLLHSPVIGIEVTFRQLLTGRTSQLSPEIRPDDLDVCQLRLSPRLASSQAILPLLRSATSSAVTNALSQFESWRLMEPMVQVELRLPVDNRDGPNESLSRFLGDLSSRRAEIESVDTKESAQDRNNYEGYKYHVIRATAPLSELVGYSRTVRSLSSGRAELHLHLTEYSPVGKDHQKELLSQLRWTSAQSN